MNTQTPFLFPLPAKAAFSSETFSVPAILTIALPEHLTSLAPLLGESLGRPVTIVSDPASADLTFASDHALAKEASRLVIMPNGLTITSSAPNGAYYALVTLGQLLSQADTVVPCGTIEDAPALPVRGFMLDISRGKIPTLGDLCELVDRLAALKYNQLQLYVEGFSFAYPSFPEVWEHETPITGEEIRYLDAYCKARFIELVPNQNSLGHMASWIARDEFRHLAESETGMEFLGSTMPPTTLNPLDPESLQLVVRLMDDMIPFFSSDKFNVNLDEPFELGKGKSKAEAEARGEAALYMDYLKKLHKEVEARGKSMYMWGDILMKHPETVADLPQGITVLDWGYEDIYPFEENTALLEKTGVPFIVCPGTATWTSISGRTDNMLGCVRNAASAAIHHHGQGLVMTEWGDNGHMEYEPLNDGPIAFAAACAWGRCDTTEAELAQYLDRFVYHDTASQMGQLVLDFGRCNHYEEFAMLNMTLANLTLRLGVLPEGAFDQVLQQTASQFLTFTSGPTAEILEKRFADKKTFDYHGLCTHLADLRSRLASTQLSGPHADLLRRELENAIRFAEFANGVHYLNAAGSDILPDEPRREKAAELAALGERAIRIHESLWLSRNRLHDLNGSTADVAKVIQQLRSFC